MKGKTKVWVTNIREDYLKDIGNSLSLHALVFDANVDNKERIGIYRIMSPSEYKSIMSNGYFMVESKRELIDNKQYKRELDDIMAVSNEVD